MNFGKLKEWIQAAEELGIKDNDYIECGVTSSTFEHIRRGTIHPQFDVHTHGWIPEFRIKVVAE